MHRTKFKSDIALVYSTATGRLCPQCRRAQSECQCKSKPMAVIRSDGVVRISRETKGRGGKSVCVITGLTLAPAQLETLCTQLKKRCGSGGTVKDGHIEIQGEHRDTLVTELSKLGYTVKKAGG